MAAIEPDTLRMWERRYGFPKPRRTAGGARVYSPDDVDVLRLIARAQKEGFRAGEVVGRTRAELVSLLEAAGAVSRESVPGPPAPPPHAQDDLVERLLHALGRSEASTVRKELRKAALHMGPKVFVTDLAAPLLARLGELWEAKVLDIHHEHLMTKLLSTQLRILLSASEDLGADRTVLLATPTSELHELGLEMVAVYLAFHQVEPRFIGVDSPAAQIVEAARSLRVDAVGLTISNAADLARVKAEVERVARGLGSDRPLWLGGAGARRLELRGPNIRCVDGWAELDRAIRDLRDGDRPPARSASRSV
jgi:DNA-binding transcriptional MerR regulator/methylmalonyl-CoA mutase cobalamin-binding subunit